MLVLHVYHLVPIKRSKNQKVKRTCLDHHFEPRTHIQLLLFFFLFCIVQSFPIPLLTAVIEELCHPTRLALPAAECVKGIGSSKIE